MIAADLARVADWPAIAVVIPERVNTGEIQHSKTGHEMHSGCMQGYCRYTYNLVYRVKHLDRLPRPGRELGVRPIAQEVLRWHHEVARRMPRAQIYTTIDASGGDYRGMFAEVLASGPQHHLTGLEITSGEAEPTHSPGQRWLRVPRTKLIQQLEVRFEQREIEIPREPFEVIKGELLTMRRKVSDGRQLIYESGAYDDLVITLAMATWAEPPHPIYTTDSTLIWD